MLGTLISFAISLLIGLLIGMEREHSHPEGVQAIGVRTFILFSLLGTLAATLNQTALTMTISAFVFSIIALGYIRSTDRTRKQIEVGITTETAAAIVFCLGYFIPSANLLAITISAFVLLILVERKRLHTLSRKKIKPHEIETTIILVIFALGILPILPNHTIDPWDFFNPRNFGILIVTIAVIQYAGYILIRLFGERFGLAMTGFLGGLVSSTIVFANLPHTIRSHPKLTLGIIASSCLAITATLIEVLLVLFVASPTLLIYIMKPILTMIVISITLAIGLLHHQKTQTHPASPDINPINLISILRTALFIAFMLFIIAITKRYIGTQGVLFMSFLGGLVEIQGISLATALLYLDHQLMLNSAKSVLYIALFASFISKLILLWGLTPIRFALLASTCMSMIVLGGGIAYWLT